MHDSLSYIFQKLSIEGTLYFRASFTIPWGIHVPAYENVARFHFVHKGDCKVRLPQTGETTILRQGDLMIIPHGAAHDLFCGRSEKEVIFPLDQVLEQSGYSGEGTLVYGGDEDERDTQLICGHISFGSGRNHVIFDHLPPMVKISNYGETAGRWLEATLRLIGDETASGKAGADFITLRMTEVLFAQAMRSFIESNGHQHLGFAGLADPHLSRALHAFHKAPAKGWSVESLAKEAGLSRTSFAIRFLEKMGRPPMQYLTSWRMQIAQHNLSHHKLSITEVAELSGYASESAFTRVFKKEIGVTPSAFRSTI